MTEAIACAQRAGEVLSIFKSRVPCDPSETSFVLGEKKKFHLKIPLDFH